MYASGSKALAALELLVHLVPPVTFSFLAFRVEFDNDLMEKLSTRRLPKDWNTEPPGATSRLIGDSWAKQNRSVVLEVPSVLVSGEPNYIINPHHQDYSKLVIGKPEQFSLDPRLLG